MRMAISESIAGAARVSPAAEPLDPAQGKSRAIRLPVLTHKMGRGHARLSWKLNCAALAAVGSFITICLLIQF